MTKFAATKTTTALQQEGEGEEEEQSLSSFYNPIRLKLYTPAEIEYCESSRAIEKYISMQRQFKPRVQAHRTKQECSLLPNSSTDIIIRHLLTIF
jgi:hypothetical protein